MISLLRLSSGLTSGARSDGRCPMICSSAVSSERRVGLPIVIFSLKSRRATTDRMERKFWSCVSRRLHELDACGTHADVILGVATAHQTPELRLDVRRCRAIRKYLQFDATCCDEAQAAVGIGEKGGDCDWLVEQSPDFLHSHVPPARSTNVPIEGL